MDNNNLNNGIKDVDILTLIGLFKQIENMKLDKEQTLYIRKVIQAIANEIEKLHKENDMIIEQNKKILEQLNKIRIHII